jgi:hypothetical protein
LESRIKIKIEDENKMEFEKKNLSSVYVNLKT